MIDFGMRAFGFLVLCLYCGNSQPNSQYFSYSTSVAAMVKLLDIEYRMIDVFEKGLSSIRKYNGTIQRSSQYVNLQKFLTDIRSENKKLKMNPEKSLSNPLKSFPLIRRIYIDWPAVFGYFRSQINEWNLSAIDLGLKKWIFPINSDLNEAVQGMERIRKTYNLSPIDMANGILNGVKYDGTLSRIDLFTIGFELFKLEMFAEALPWVNASLYANNTRLCPKDICDFNMEDAHLLYADTLYQLSSSIKTLEEDAKKVNTKMEQFCPGEAQGRSKEFCRYRKVSKHFQHLAPIKMEQLSMDPYVVIYHDVLTYDEIVDTKNKARKRFQPADVLRTTTRASDFRSTHIAEVDLKKSVLDKIVAITGFESSRFEATSVLNYGLGGHYIMHKDFLDYPDVGSGNRKATVLVYLNDVEQGGETIFPLIRVSVKPRKGSLLLWHNLKYNGMRDWNTLHGACPVIFGSKWAISIFVREKPVSEEKCYTRVKENVNLCH